MNEKIVNAMADLNEDDLYDELRTQIKSGVPVGSVLADLQLGMTEVGNRFEAKKYFLSELIMSAEIFKEAIKMLDLPQGESQHKHGTFVIGTVFGDIHDIGKNIVVSVMRANGFKVIDLGVDVKPESFIKAVKEENPQVIGISCLLTTAYDNMKEVISQLRAQGLADDRLILIGGGPTDAHTVKYTGADYFCTSAQDGVTKAKKFLGV